VTFKGRLRQFRTSPAEFDQARLREVCAGLGMAPIAEARARQEVSVAGEISSLRIVPRAGSPSLEATITDGSGSIVAVWTGRRQIAGVGPGRRLVVHGRANPAGGNGRLVVYNPSYELL
jgi:hypothetical protein